MNTFHPHGWRKSSHSGGAGLDCVEMKPLDDGSVGVRDSKLGDDSPVLTFTRREFAAWLSGAKGGEFDDLT